ncbi:MAG: helix-hairpin-helix domain-containing protein [Nitrospiraceae bacterium]
MKLSSLVSVVLMGILVVAGCALQFRQRTSESVPKVKAMRAQQAYLEQQVQSLNDLNDKLTEHSDSLVVQLQRTKAVQKTEDAEAEERLARLKQLEQAVADLTAQYDTLQVGFQKLRQDNKALKKTVARYRKGRETRQLTAQNRNEARALPQAKVGHTKKKEPVQRQRAKVAAKPQRAPNAAEQSPQVVAVQTPAASPRVNINLASLNDLTSYLGLPKETAEQLVSHRPYRIKGELVAKQILPRETFYQIKDRMTAAQ